jgi:hypothetical protein
MGWLRRAHGDVGRRPGELTEVEVSPWGDAGV